VPPLFPAPAITPKPLLSRGFRSRSASGYTLVELLVAMVVLSIVLVGVVMTMRSVQSAWALTRSSVREHIEGRRALETVASQLALCLLPTRWVPDDEAIPNAPLNPAGPTGLITESDLHFVCGQTRTLLPNLRASSGHSVFFQAPFGFAGSQRQNNAGPDSALYLSLPNTLNAWGYYVEFDRDARQLPSFITSARPGRPRLPNRHRFRLMEFRQPTHELPLFFVDPATQRPLLSNQPSTVTLYDWFRIPIELSARGQSAIDRRSSVVAENILALLVVPYDPQLQVLQGAASDSSLPYQLAPDYHFDSRRHQWDRGSPRAALSRHQLPSSLEIVIVALSEDSWDSLSEAEAINQGEFLVSFMSGRFNIAANFANDLRDLSNTLDSRRLGHKILSQVVHLNGLAGRLALPNAISSP
jgi:uncharacterized protein (TIGR02599 family)